MQNLCKVRVVLCCEAGLFFFFIFLSEPVLEAEHINGMFHRDIIKALCLWSSCVGGGPTGGRISPLQLCDKSFAEAEGDTIN